MRSAALRRDGATGECELRTRFAGLSLAKYRGAPPRTRFGPRRTRDFSDLVGSFAEQRRFRRSSRSPRSPSNHRSHPGTVAGYPSITVPGGVRAMRNPPRIPGRALAVLLELLQMLHLVTDGVNIHKM
jgi:hypothetical protein